MKIANSFEKLATLFTKLPPTEVGHWNLHHIPIARKVLSITRPHAILEIGFNRGHSSLIWLELSCAKLFSIDHGVLPGIKQTESIVSSLYPTRFSLLYSDSRSAHPFLFDRKFDLLFIDGGHSYDVCFNDLSLAPLLNIPYIVLDDANFLRTASAIADFTKIYSLKLIKHWNLRNGISLFKMDL